MHQNAIAVTLVRLFAVGLIIYAFRNASFAIFILDISGSSIFDLYTMIAGVLVPAGIAAFMWLVPAKIIGLPSKAQSSFDDSAISMGPFFGLGVALIGIYLAVTSAASIFDWVIAHRQGQREFGELLYTSSASYYSLYSELFQFVVGILLFLGSSGLARIFLALRSHGIDVPDSPNKGFNRPPESPGPAKPGEPGGGAG